MEQEKEKLKNGEKRGGVGIEEEMKMRKRREGGGGNNGGKGYREVRKELFLLFSPE